VDGQRRVIGTIATSDIVRSYRRALQIRLRQASELGGETGMLDVVVAEHASIVGATLRTAQIPRGVLITSIERGHEVIAPTGDTVIRPGDRMMVLGSSDDLSQLAQLASSKP
jgi:Trk K+ transport system NAD-binding subunit